MPLIAMLPEMPSEPFTTSMPVKSPAANGLPWMSTVASVEVLVPPGVRLTRLVVSMNTIPLATLLLERNVTPPLYDEPTEAQPSSRGGNGLGTGPVGQA